MPRPPRPPRNFLTDEWLDTTYPLEQLGADLDALPDQALQTIRVALAPLRSRVPSRARAIAQFRIVEAIRSHTRIGALTEEDRHGPARSPED